MLADLPKSLQQQVLCYLETNNFRAAKKIHDDWLNQLQPNVVDYSPSGNIDQNSLIYVSLIAFTVKSLSHVLQPLIPIFFKASAFTYAEGVGQ